MVQVLDCTLRDGGYYNDWDFSDQFVEDYLALLPSLGISHAELGFRFLRSKNHLGPWAYTPDEKIRDFRVPSGLEIGVMLNLSEIKELRSSLVDIEVFEKGTPLNFVRLAAHSEELPLAQRVISELHALELKVGLNLMQISEKSPDDLKYFAQVASEADCDFIYVADSLGACSEDDINRIFALLKSEVDFPLGIHAHDNRGEALSNTLAAMQLGAEFVDSTLGGMGRGAGNTRTEALVLELSRLNKFELANESLEKLAVFLEKHIAPLQEQYRWGSNLAYILAANWGVHPTFVQEMLDDKTPAARVVSSLINLRDVKATKYDKELVRANSNLKNKTPKYEFSAEIPLLEDFKKLEGIVIIGSGSRAKSHLRHIVRFAEKKRCAVFLLNSVQVPGIESKLVLRLAAHQDRLNSIGKEFWNLPERKVVADIGVADFDISGEDVKVKVFLDEQGFGFAGMPFMLPNNLTLSFALALAAHLQANQIFLAGIDGYDDSDLRNSEIARSLELFREVSEIPVLAITPTRIPANNLSIYWRGED